MVAQWYDLRLTTRETRVRILPWASSDHVTTRSTSPQHLRSPMLTFATKKLSTGANGQKEDAASFFCPRSFDRAVMTCLIMARHAPGPGDTILGLVLILASDSLSEAHWPRPDHYGSLARRRQSDPNARGPRQHRLGGAVVICNCQSKMYQKYMFQ